MNEQRKTGNMLARTTASGLAPRRTRRAARAAAGFTLIELLVVIGLSALLLALLFTPIVEGLRITNRTHALVQAQDASRFGLEQVRRELGEAAYVFDNTNSQIALPLEAGTTVTRTQNGVPIYSSTRPDMAFARLDLAPSDVRAGTNVALDPTTGLPVGGASVRLPGAPAGVSTARYIRYFIALQNPLKPYSNLYEFRQTDSSFNPFVLYRAVYSPTDPTLIEQNSNGTPNMTDATPGDGGFYDPEFFYSGPYAANWQAISKPVVQGANLDLLIWQRNSNGLIDVGSPYRLGVSFAPATTVGDIATPGFLSNDNAEAAGAVPTLYTTQHANWTLPFTVNVFRGVNNANAAATGNLSLTFMNMGTGSNAVLTCTPAGTGVFSGVTASNLYVLRSNLTGKYFVSAPGIDFWIDPMRGRIETGLPPISAANTGAPLVYPYNANGFTLNTSNVEALPPGTSIQQAYELVQTVYRTTTLDVADSGQTYNDPSTGNAIYIPSNQGILFVDLSAATPSTTAAIAGYFSTTSLTNAINNAGSTVSSPFVSFNGAILAPGTEQVIGPNDALTAVNATGPALLNTYSRFGVLNSSSNNDSIPPATTGAPGTYVRNSPLQYTIPTEYKYSSVPKLDFIDAPPYTLTGGSAAYEQWLVNYGSAGLPASPSQPEAELQVSFLWQNNYARDAAGNPIDINGNEAQASNAAGTSNNGFVSPQPDTFRVDYGTRSLINVGLGVQVYDPSNGQAEAAQVSDKVKINNGGQ